MAYFSQKDKEKVSPAIKAVFKKYGVKGTLGVRNHSTLIININSGSIDFIAADLKIRERYARANGDSDPVVPRLSLDINEYSIVDSLERVDEFKIAEFFRELIRAAKSAGWYDKSDVQTDYFDTAYYLDINVGKWNKPYVLVK